MKLLPFFLLLLISCNDQETQTGEQPSDTTSATKDEVPQQEPSLAGCYRQVIQRDTVLLVLEQNGNSVKGSLKFDNYQKDSSSGTVEGTVEGDKVVVWYDFFSEGMHSVMEIIYQKQGDNLVRAVGEMEVRGDSALFKTHEGVRYDPKQTLVRIDCP